MTDWTIALLRRQLELERAYYAGAAPTQLVRELLQLVLESAGCELGFVAVVYPQRRAVIVSQLGSAWNTYTAGFFDELELEWNQLQGCDSLLGAALSSEDVEIPAPSGPNPDVCPTRMLARSATCPDGARVVVGAAGDASQMVRLGPPMELALDSLRLWARALAGPPAQQADIHEVAERARAIVETMHDAVISIEPFGAIRSVNPATTTMFGYRADQLVGQNVAMLVAGDSISHTEVARHEDLATGQQRMVGDKSMVGRRSDGSTFPIEVLVSRGRFRGQPILAWIARDLTDLRQVERLKDQFVSTVSHELRTPLTSIRGSLGLLAGGALGQLDDEVQELVEIGLANAERLLLLVDDLLVLQKLDSGTRPLSLDAVDLSGLLQELVDSLAAAAADAGVRLVLEPFDPVVMEIDREQMMQVLVNLVGNAIKFSPPGEAVRIAALARETTTEISVTDSGPGIAEADFERIFERFVQASAGRNRRHAGTGLGLAIAREIVERHGGHVRVESELGCGSRFVVELER